MRQKTGRQGRTKFKYWLGQGLPWQEVPSKTALNPNKNNKNVHVTKSHPNYQFHHVVVGKPHSRELLCSFPPRATSPQHHRPLRPFNCWGRSMAEAQGAEAEGGGQRCNEIRPPLLPIVSSHLLVTGVTDPQFPGELPHLPTCPAAITVY